jgi:hypothetical protein
VKRVLHIVELERLDHGFDLLHAGRSPFSRIRLMPNRRRI